MSILKCWRVPLVLVLTLFVTVGCATTRGSPKPLLKRTDINGPGIVNAKDQVKKLTTGLTLFDAADAIAERNQAQRNLMALADLRFSQYKIDLVNNRRGSRAGSGALTLMSNVAAKLTDSIGVKDNYIALSTLIEGGEAVFDKEYLFDKTIDSLIARMEADREAKKLKIYKQHELSIAEYTGQSALADALEYFHAGTLSSALVSANKSIHETAEEDREESERLLSGLISPTATSNRLGNERATKLVATLDSDGMEKLRDFLREKTIDVPQSSSDEGKRKALRRALVLYRTERLEAGKTEDDIFKELSDAGFKDSK